MTPHQSLLSDLTPDRFLFRFDVLPNIHFRLTSAPIPGIASTPPKIGTRAPQRFTPNGNNVELSAVNLVFVVDENLDNWLEAFKWVHKSTTSDDLFEDGVLGNGTLLVLDSDMQEALECHFYDCVPLSLSDIILTVNDQSTYVTATLSFDYSGIALKGKNFEVSFI